MKFIIFGGTGFVGRNLVSYIKCRGGEVVSVSRTGGIDSVSLDINSPLDFNKIDTVPDVIVNCASRIPAKGNPSCDPKYLKELFTTNVVGGANIANWAVQNKVGFLINCSTLVVVKKPWPKPLREDFSSLPDGFHAGYSMSKLSQEQIMHECTKGTDTQLINMRLSAVYGNGMAQDGIIFSLLKKFEKNQTVELIDAKKNSLDLIHVVDVCKSIYKIGVEGAKNDIINLARGEEVSIFHLAKLLKNITGSTSKIKDTVTKKPASKAEISVERLINNIGDVYHEFIPLKAGLNEIVANIRH